MTTWVGGTGGGGGVAYSKNYPFCMYLDLKSSDHKKTVDSQAHFSGEACIGVLGIQDICHFTSKDIGYYPFYFQGYGILCSIFWLLWGILKI